LISLLSPSLPFSPSVVVWPSFPPSPLHPYPLHPYPLSSLPPPLPFPSPSIPLPFLFPSLPLEVGPLIQLGVWGSEGSLSGAWGRASVEIEFGAF